MPEEGSILAYWSARKEPVQVCAERLAKTLVDLEKIGGVFSSWSDVKHRAKFFKIESDAASLTQLLSSSPNKTDFPPRKAIEELGFRISLRTDGKAWEHLLFRAHCGGFAKEVPNSCIIDLPKIGPHSYETSEAALKVKLLRTLIRNWNPDRGAICSRRFYRSLEAEEPRAFFGDLGWITYIPHRRGEIPEEVKRKFYVEEIPSFGNLIYLTNEPPQDETGPSYLKMAIELYQALERHGIYCKAPVLTQQ
jgi:hypothetical protein